MDPARTAGCVRDWHLFCRPRHTLEAHVTLRVAKPALATDVREPTSVLALEHVFQHSEPKSLHLGERLVWA